jgi:hypothetical protein
MNFISSVINKLSPSWDELLLRRLEEIKEKTWSTWAFLGGTRFQPDAEVLNNQVKAFIEKVKVYQQEREIPCSDPARHCDGEC